MAKNRREDGEDFDSADETESTANVPSDPHQTRAHHPGNPEGDVAETGSGDKQQHRAKENFGPYRLIQKLGAGGMGDVWMAEQSHPVKRRIALKLIKVGIGSKEIIARFDAERQALALMNHPNIARILDAGTTDEGQPFFVMELVSGTPLTAYCDQNRLGIDERLKLFTDVCSGVQHAHQKGIIHRDLKPGNIIVGLQDGQAVPKIIDFGLAKAMESTQKLTDQSLFTGIGQILGTLKYMSPEQASLDTVDIDTRTDIYALGVILYELLTGSAPLDDSSIKGLAVLKILEFIRDKEPVKPSSKLSSSTDEQVSAITGQRRTDNVRLNRILAGDLDWIVMKALEKDRTRRYESASGFAADIRRYLNSEPVIARPPSLNYRVRKFVRKNRMAVIAASLVTLALLGGIVGTTLGLIRALTAEQLAENRLVEAIVARNGESEQRGLADARRSEAEREREVAETRRLEAVRNLTFAKKGNEILSSVFSGLDPKAEYSTVADLRNALKDNLQSAVGQLEGSAIGDALVVADMQMHLSESLLGLGEPQLSIKLLEQARETRSNMLGLDHPNTLTSMNHLGLAYQNAFQLDKALALFEQTLELRKVKLGNDHAATLATMNNLAIAYQAAGQLDRALAMYEQTLDLTTTKLGSEHPGTLICMFNLAVSYQEAGHVDLALPLFEQTLALMKTQLGIHHPDTLASMNRLANTYRTAGQFERALELMEQTLELCKTNLGPEHPKTLASMNDRALIYLDLGRMGEALSLFEHLLELRKFHLGLDHPVTLTSMGNLATAYSDNGQLDKAIPLYEQALNLRKIKLGPDHPVTLTSMGNLAMAYGKAGQLDKALTLQKKTLELMIAKLGPDHPSTLNSMGNLAVIFSETGQFVEALPLFKQTLELRKAKLGDDHPDTLVSQNDLADGYYSAGQMDKALPLFEQTLELRKAKLGPDHPATLTSMNGLALAHQSIGQLDTAFQLFEQTIAKMKFKLGPDHPNTLTSMDNLALVFQRSGKSDKSLSLYEQTLALSRNKLGAKHPITLTRMGNLAQAYLNAGQLEKAQTLSEQTHELMKSELGPDDSNTLIVMNNLAMVYKATGQFDKALPLLEQALRVQEEKLGRSHLDTLTSMNNLALAYQRSGKLDKALPMIEQSLDLWKSKLGPDHPVTLNSMNNLALVYKEVGKLDLALLLHEQAAQGMERLQFRNQFSTAIVQNAIKAYEDAKAYVQADLWREKWQVFVKEQTGEDSIQFAGELASHGLALVKREDWPRAEQVIRQCLSLREKHQPDLWSTFNTQSMLGATLLGQKKNAEAEPLLLAGYHGMKQREESIPEQGKVRLTEAVQRLVELYTATDQPEKVAEWKSKLPPEEKPIDD